MDRESEELICGHLMIYINYSKLFYRIMYSSYAASTRPP